MLKVWLGSAIRIWVFSISSWFFPGLCTASHSPQNKHSPGFCSEIWEDASTCADQVEREKKQHTTTTTTNTQKNKTPKASAPLRLGLDQRCRHHRPKYVLSQTNNTSLALSTSLFVHWSFAPPRKNNFIQCHKIFNETGNLSHCVQFDVTATYVTAPPPWLAPPPPPPSPWLPSTAAPAVDLSGPAGSAVHGDCF